MRDELVLVALVKLASRLGEITSAQLYENGFVAVSGRGFQLTFTRGD